MEFQKVDIELFLELHETFPVVDVRSPSEFNLGHIPRAINIPLFNDSERAAVGKKFKNGGRRPAIIEGLTHAGPALSSKLEQALKIAGNGSLLVHCWRGGMRSEAMAWLFAVGGIDVKVLMGGYKSYRHHVLERLSAKKKMIVLGGLTGSSKTLILRYLKSAGHQVVDLEKLANHKGSAFGAIGQMPQPTTEQFSNILFDEWERLNTGHPCWIEDESRNIGSVFLPDSFYLNMQNTPVIILLMDLQTRLPHLIEEYSIYPLESLKESVTRISKRLGGDKTRDALDALERRDFAKAVEIVLYYYDKAYLFGLKKKTIEKIIYVNTDTADIMINAEKVAEAAKKIKWDCPSYS